jgi:hypothetical protein
MEFKCLARGDKSLCRPRGDRERRDRDHCVRLPVGVPDGMMSGAGERTFVPLLRAHDVGVILQSIFMMPLVHALGDILGRRWPNAQRTTVVAGIAALTLTILSLVLSIAGVLSGQLFMIWQGMLGAWLIVVCRLVSDTFSRGLRRFGTVVGVGLLIVAVFPIGYLIFVDPHLGPVPWDYEGPAGTEKANDILHTILGIGGFLGVATLPIWTALMGRRVLKMGAAAR